MAERYDAFLSIGSNMGDRQVNIASAVEKISKIKDIKLIKQSPLYETAPVGFEQQPKFLNCVVKIATNLDPLKLLENLHEIEIQLGRKRIEYWGSRTMDIDILLCGDRIIREAKLKVPHPLMYERGFVMVPLLDVLNDDELILFGIAKNEGDKWRDSGIHPYAKD
ncbi:MAG: 2-amino-4-hydroxy-6-hydroxymethyldihydropteridine diphosphokinase [Bacillota bacterium]